MHETYHTGSDLSTVKSRFVFYRVMHPSSLTLRRDKACDKVGFCDDPPSLKLWRTGVPDQARPTRRARQQATRPAGFCPAFFKKALIELRQRSSETPGNPPSGCATAVKIFHKNWENNKIFIKKFLQIRFDIAAIRRYINFIVTQGCCCQEDNGWDQTLWTWNG